MIVIINFRDLCEDALLLLGRAELGEPFSLSCSFLLLLLQISLRVCLELLVIL
jgi:hypothetical protein